MKSSLPNRPSALLPEVSGLGTKVVIPSSSHARISSPSKGNLTTDPPASASNDLLGGREHYLQMTRRLDGSSVDELISPERMNQGLTSIAVALQVMVSHMVLVNSTPEITAFPFDRDDHRLIHKPRVPNRPWRLRSGWHSSDRTSCTTVEWIHT